MPDLLIEVPPSRSPERRYITEVMLGEFLGLSHRLVVDTRTDVRITASADPSRREVIVDDVFFASADEHWLREQSVPRNSAGTWHHPDRDLPGSGAWMDNLPVLFGETDADGRFMERSEKRIRVGADLFGSSFFMLSRYEEAVSGDRDEHGRFPATCSLALREGFLHRPVVNEYVEVLWALIRWLAPDLRRREHRFSIVPSHDVDRPRWLPGRRWQGVIRDAFLDATVRGDPGLAARKLVGKTWEAMGRPDRDPCNTFDWIMDVSERLGLTSAFYFMAGPTAESPVGRYSIDDPWIRMLVRRIADRGHEVGLHTTYATWQDPELTHRECVKLRAVMEDEGVRQTTLGGRQHYLRWSNPHTWQNWEDAGLAYDSTLGFADHVGFRCGSCLEYPTFNLTTRRPLRLREKPLIVMDGSLFNYMNLSADDARISVIELAAACRRHGGELTLLWHNNTLMSRAAKDFYRRTLEEASETSSEAQVS